MFRQSECQLLDSQARLRLSTLGCFAHYEVHHHRCHVFELQGTDASAQRGVGAVTRIQQQDIPTFGWCGQRIPTYLPSVSLIATYVTLRRRHAKHSPSGTMATGMLLL